MGENSCFTGQLEIDQARPDAVAVLHERSLWAQIWASQPRLLEPFNTDSAIIESIRAVRDPLVAKDGGGEHLRPQVRDFWQATPDGAENHFRPYLQQVLNDHRESRIVIAHGA
ncbi:hypothetical protein CHR55_32410 [Rhodococcus qingshengii]|uniref:Uncharacterized protein n=1 Tax=Rhodococcus qingshengii TaxID=334542 RepID=A0A2A5IZM0_RHOSG|nr:hypothetical protein CHR55_32410 [Rhodococcus qingshengii]